jgi:hypothetical protein
VRETWAPHAIEGWSLGPALRQYRCYHVWALTTNEERVSDTLTWFPTTGIMSRQSSINIVIAVAERPSFTLHQLPPYHPCSTANGNTYVSCPTSSNITPFSETLLPTMNHLTHQPQPCNHQRSLHHLQGCTHRTPQRFHHQNSLSNFQGWHHFTPTPPPANKPLQLVTPPSIPVPTVSPTVTPPGTPPQQRITWATSVTNGIAPIVTYISATVNLGKRRCHSTKSQKEAAN